MIGGYIYLIENTVGEEVRYKIGYAGNIEKRLKQLQTGNPGLMNVVRIYKTSWGRILEKTLHDKYSKFNIQNEWFILNKQQIDTFIKECEKKEKILDSLKDNYFFKKKYKL